MAATYTFIKIIPNKEESKGKSLVLKISNKQCPQLLFGSKGPMKAASTCDVVCVLWKLGQKHMIGMPLLSPAVLVWTAHKELYCAQLRQQTETRHHSNTYIIAIFMVLFRVPQ